MAPETILLYQNDSSRAKTPFFSETALTKQNKINAICLKKDKVKFEIKIKIHRALVKSVLLYNCGTWGVSSNVQQRLDAYHRRQLRRILGIKYPTRISNEKLYKVTGEKPISYTMRERDGNYLVIS